jgi:hypothetical protein
MKLAMAAFLAGRQVRWQGSGTCTIDGDKENLKALYVK